ncbi:diguanylate cyclase (GGDEF)-like protein [Roseibium hamelinense]|uniref:Diguanylate cyclase (GGDEF)-like protein n=1 Tax=Roseibium hamelinense TaxID=150831 RepID=A0A562TA18_9HYPH|nr:EAL domain-containing protein [Roseibium hamelinense]MTI45483.1 EAL domain-containing protein [Roseibium hamelinense]TWI90143.1 diguanylate cyclase (GGDEF)-like protein [Roseibium hamelinense]
MQKLKDFTAWLFIDPAHPTIALAQYREMRRQIPLLYALLIVNACAVAYTHYSIAPHALVLGVLIPLVSISSFRMITWLRRKDVPTDPVIVIRELRRTLFLSVVLGGFYIAWSLALDSYGGPMQRGHVALFIAITVVGCIFCLMYLPQAALGVMAVVTLPYMMHYVSQGEDVYIAIALNILLVCLVMITVLLNGYTAFTKLIRSQADLAAKNEETERLSAENARLAHTDALTNLPNRRYFFNEVDRQIEQHAANQSSFAVGVLDLDRFKLVNDTYGHQFGDILLTMVGDRLREFVSEKAQVTRLGGDEFGLLYFGALDELEAFGQKICTALSAPYQIGETPVAIGCSCGLAIYPDAGTNGPVLFDRSDYALYNSKTNRRGQSTVYSSAHEATIKSERAIESALQRADLDTEFQVFFQPIICLRKNRIKGFESLARWNSPSLGPVPPARFIPVAERCGQIQRLTVSLFNTALDSLLQMPDLPVLSFNLSAHDISNPETVDALLSAIGRRVMDPERVSFEITETAVIADYETANASLHRLREAGARIVLDDFGTGYSSLGYLHRLPIDGVKVDRSFVSALGESGGHKVVSSVIALCNAMKLSCVVEGVEEEWQAIELRKLGCSQVQGYFFARPMPAANVVADLNASGEIAGLPLALPRTQARSANG